MTDKTISEREAVERERAAFIAGARAAATAGGGWCHGAAIVSVDGREHRDDNAAAWRYPLPKVTRPRVLGMPVSNGNRLEFRLVGDEFQERLKTPDGQSDWQHTGGTTPTPERVRLWADLLANPTETVEG